MESQPVKMTNGMNETSAPISTERLVNSRKRSGSCISPTASRAPLTTPSAPRMGTNSRMRTNGLTKKGTAKIERITIRWRSEETNVTR
jgi:hypothetical protein